MLCGSLIKRRAKGGAEFRWKYILDVYVSLTGRDFYVQVLNILLSYALIFGSPRRLYRGHRFVRHCGECSQLGAQVTEINYFFMLFGE